MSLIEWAVKHKVTPAALWELQNMMGYDTGMPEVSTSVQMMRDEAYVQSMAKLKATRQGVHPWRNNVGVLEDREGRPVRFGLANDSPKLNEKLKSSDLVGWRTVIIHPLMVGYRIAQFWCRECKEPGWVYSGTGREVAQKRWIDLVNKHGGDAAFVSDPDKV